MVPLCRRTLAHARCFAGVQPIGEDAFSGR